MRVLFETCLRVEEVNLDKCCHAYWKKRVDQRTNKSMETQISSIQQHLNIFLGYILFRTWTDGYSDQGQLKNSKGEFPWSCSMTSGNVEFPLFWTFTQRRQTAEPIGQVNPMFRWSRCRNCCMRRVCGWNRWSSVQRCGFLLGGTGVVARTMDWWTCCRLFEQSLSKLQPRQTVTSSSHVSICIINMWREPCDKSTPWMRTRL